jgi:hypothetical protein
MPPSSRNKDCITGKLGKFIYLPTRSELILGQSTLALIHNFEREALCKSFVHAKKRSMPDEKTPEDVASRASYAVPCC